MKPNKLALLATAVAVTFAATACHRQQTGESGGEVSPATTGADTSAAPTNPTPAAQPDTSAGRDTTKMVGDTTGMARDTTGMARDTTMGGMSHDTTMTKTDSTNKVPPTR
jgi:hypothetical protein